MENKNILIVGFINKKAKKIADFLKRKAFSVYAMDRIVPFELKVEQFYRIDPRYKDNIKLVIGMTQPEVIIFCPEEVVAVDYSYPTSLALFPTLLESNVKKLVVCLDDIVREPKTVNEVSQLAIYCLTDIYTNNFQLDTMVVTNKDNLLKKVKRFVTKIEEMKENGFTNQSQKGREEVL